MANEERRMKKETKKKLIKTLVWTALLYGSETWTLRKEEIRRLEAMEMWLWRRMEKISWTEKVVECMRTYYCKKCHIILVIT